MRHGSLFSGIGGFDLAAEWVDRVKALGNSVVPQVVYEIFKTIEQWEKYYQTEQ